MESLAGKLKDRRTMMVRQVAATLGIERWDQRAGKLEGMLGKHPDVVSRWARAGAERRSTDQEFARLVDELDATLSEDCRRGRKKDRLYRLAWFGCRVAREPLTGPTPTSRRPERSRCRSSGFAVVHGHVWVDAGNHGLDPGLLDDLGESAGEPQIVAVESRLEWAVEPGAGTRRTDLIRRVAGDLREWSAKGRRAKLAAQCRQAGAVPDALQIGSDRMPGFRILGSLHQPMLPSSTS